MLHANVNVHVHCIIIVCDVMNFLQGAYKNLVLHITLNLACHTCIDSIDLKKFYKRHSTSNHSKVGELGYVSFCSTAHKTGSFDRIKCYKYVNVYARMYVLPINNNNLV